MYSYFFSSFFYKFVQIFLFLFTFFDFFYFRDVKPCSGLGAAEDASPP